jgi:hypothetical protein
MACSKLKFTFLMGTHFVYCEVRAELSYYYLNDFWWVDGQCMKHTWKEKFMNVLVGKYNEKNHLEYLDVDGR